MVCNYSDGVQKEDLFLMGVLTNAADQHFLSSHICISTCTLVVLLSPHCVRNRVAQHNNTHYSRDR